MADLTVVRVRPEPSDWELLRSAIAAAGRHKSSRKRRRRGNGNVTE